MLINVKVVFSVIIAILSTVLHHSKKGKPIPAWLQNLICYLKWPSKATVKVSPMCKCTDGSGQDAGETTIVRCECSSDGESHYVGTILINGKNVLSIETPAYRQP